MDFLPEIIKKRIHDTMIRQVSTEKETPSCFNCRVVLDTALGIIDFGNFYTKTPNTLFRQLKSINGVYKVRIEVCHDVD